MWTGSIHAIMKVEQQMFFESFFVIVLYMLNVVNLTCTTVFNREQNH